jgi:membrane protein
LRVPSSEPGAIGFLKALARRISDNAATERAAQLSYCFIFALFPFLFFAVTLAAYLPTSGAIDQLLARLDPVIPDEAGRIIRAQLTALTTEQKPHLLTIGLALAVWSASRGIDALRSSLNRSYGVRESRPWWRVQLSAIALTVGTSVVMLLAMAAIALGGNAGLWLAKLLHVDRAWPLLWGWLRWPITAVGVELVFSALYFLLPDVKQKWRFLSPGAVVGTVLWLFASWGFSLYADNFGSYDKMYGSIGGMIVMLTWLYVTGLIFVVGGEINALARESEASARPPSPRVAQNLTNRPAVQ